LKQFTNPGFDVEPLPDSNILFVLPRNGIYEINRKGEVVWSYQNSKVSHDADRLPNGNTLVAFGAMDRSADAQVKEINPDGRIVWQWYARDYFYKPPYKDIYDEGWTHTNAVSRLPSGNTLISLRNFKFVVEVDPEGAVAKTIGEGLFSSQQDPEILPNGNMIVVLQYRYRTHRVVEIDLKTGRPIWEFAIPEPNNTPVRDANRLPNGNTLITGTTAIMEVTLNGDVVWRLELKDLIFERGEAQARGFYKAERIGTQK
jgi:outer membrane protein assembly factor BamB